MNSTQFFGLVSNGKDFQLAHSSTATTTAIWDMVLSCIILNYCKKNYVFNTNLHVFINFYIFIVWEMLYHIYMDPSCQLDILWHDSNLLAVDCT